MTAPSPRPSAVLVGVQLPEMSDEDHESDLAELGRLVDTLGYEVVATVTQKRSQLAHGAILGEGKLLELAELTGGSGSFQPVLPGGKRNQPSAHDDDLDDELDELDDDELAEGGEREGAGGQKKVALVAVDHDISPSQLRNLERATRVEVLDRTGVIIEIFHRRARSREARLQVELARLAYVAPRMRETGGGKAERQKGRGAGESALELDRRKIRDRMAELREELASIEKEQGTRRRARSQARRVALVGYTNAGKSSLMRALTGSEVLVEDRLFATLDTTVRALYPETRPRVLVSDTVGFIKKLPHDLVASFRSTLDEALESSLLLHVVDASDPGVQAQIEVTREVLKEIGADAVPTWLVWNKSDRLSPEQRESLSLAEPEGIVMSSKQKADVSSLHDRIVKFFEKSMVEAELFVPYARQAVVAQAHQEARVLGERHDEEGTHVSLRAEPATLERLKKALAKG